MTRRRTYDVAYRGRRVGLNEGARNEARPKVGPIGRREERSAPEGGPHRATRGTRARPKGLEPLTF